MRALVVGVAAGGIGDATARRLAKDAQERGESVSMTVSATGRKPELTDVVEALRAAGVDARAHTGDLRNPEFPAALVAAAVEHAGGLDLLVVNSGISRPAPLESLTVDNWDSTFNVNVRAVWLLACAAKAALEESGGNIVVTGSISESAPIPFTGAYGASKAALAMLCRQLALEFAPAGIRVNQVAPGPVRTPLSEVAYADPEFERSRTRLIPLGRIGAVDEVAGVVSFLAGPDAGFITGESIAVSGGLAHAGLTSLAASVKALAPNSAPRSNGR